MYVDTAQYEPDSVNRVGTVENDTKIRFFLFFWKTNVLRKNVHTVYLYCTLFEVVADSLRLSSFLPAVLYPPNKVCLELRKKRFSSQVFGNVQLGDQKIRQKYTKIHQFLVPYLLYREDQQQQERKHAFTVTRTVLLSGSPAFSNFTSSCAAVICRFLVVITESL